MLVPTEEEIQKIKEKLGRGESLTTREKELLKNHVVITVKKGLVTLTTGFDEIEKIILKCINEYELELPQIDEVVMAISQCSRYEYSILKRYMLEKYRKRYYIYEIKSRREAKRELEKRKR